MLLGATAATSKANFVAWVDDLVSSVAKEDCKVYTMSGARQSGCFTGLSSQEFMRVLAKFSNLRRWTSDIIANSYTCGSFVAILPGGRGRVSHQGMYLGPFQT